MEKHRRETRYNREGLEISKVRGQTYGWWAGINIVQTDGRIVTCMKRIRTKRVIFCWMYILYGTYTSNWRKSSKWYIWIMVFICVKNSPQKDCTTGGTIPASTAAILETASAYVAALAEAAGSAMTAVLSSSWRAIGVTSLTGGDIYHGAC